MSVDFPVRWCRETEAESIPVSRSAYWDRVTALVERSRRDYRAFDPKIDPPSECLCVGVGPIVDLYLSAQRQGVSLSDVERALLESVLNEWLVRYAACHAQQVYGGYTVREVTQTYLRTRSLEETARELLCV